MKKLLLLSSIALLTHQINAQCMPSITNETITASQNTICPGQTSTISIGASLPGVKYYLRDNATNAVVAGPTNGNGGPLAFSTGTLATTKTFHVYAETQPGGNVALDFNGATDKIYTDTYSAATNSLTLEAWIYPRATNYRRIISNHDGTPNPGEFLFDTSSPTNNGRGLRFYVVGPSNATHSVTISNVLTLNTWNHVASSFDNGLMRIYVNGNIVATSTASFTTIPAHVNEITIGEDPLTIIPEYFNGLIDDVRIWNTARTVTQISGNMNNCLLGNESGVKNYWKFFENSGTKVLDIVTNSVGSMSGGMTATSWTSGNVNCGTAFCTFTMTNLKTITVATCTGLEELSLANHEVVAYPNPANSSITIKTNENIETVTVYNLLGEMVQQESTTSFSVEQLPAGIYTLQIKTQNGMSTTRFVKE